MIHPTPAELVAAFRDLDDTKARLACALCDAADDADALADLVEQFPAVERLARGQLDCSDGRRTVVLHALDQLLGTHGVEPLYGPEQTAYGPEAPDYEYCNTGDSYAATLVYSRDDDAVTIGCWGDIAEGWS